MGSLLVLWVLLDQVEESADESAVESSEESVDEDEEPEEEMVAKKAQESLDDDQCGKFYCVYFTQSRYWGRLQKVIFLFCGLQIQHS